MARGGLGNRLARLEAKVFHDVWADFGDDGKRLVGFKLPNEDGSEDTTTRPYTREEAERFGRYWIPDHDDRFQNPDGTERTDVEVDP